MDIIVFGKKIKVCILYLSDIYGSAISYMKKQFYPFISDSTQ